MGPSANAQLAGALLEAIGPVPNAIRKALSVPLRDSRLRAIWLLTLNKLFRRGHVMQPTLQQLTENFQQIALEMVRAEAAHRKASIAEHQAFLHLSDCQERLKEAKTAYVTVCLEDEA